MDRRTFLVGMGRFAGAALVLPALPTIFDMGRLARPEQPALTIWRVGDVNPIVNWVIEGHPPILKAIEPADVSSFNFLTEEDRSFLNNWAKANQDVMQAVRTPSGLLVNVNTKPAPTWEPTW